jgi:hypothetical protein
MSFPMWSALVTAVGVSFIAGLFVGIILVFKKMHWLIKWGLVDDGTLAGE